MLRQDSNQAGNAASAGRRVRLCSVRWLLVVLLAAMLAKVMGLFAVAMVITTAWLALAAFTFLFFRDPTARVPPDPQTIVAPAHGRVDFVGAWNEPEFMGGGCQRVSIFLSLLDVHVQNAPIDGVVRSLQYQHGKFHAAFLRSQSLRNENLYIGLQSRDCPDLRVGVRLIAGFLARRVLDWVGLGQVVERGQRLGMIRFGSRCDLYLPPQFPVLVKPGDRVTGGETIVAQLSRLSAQTRSQAVHEETQQAPPSTPNSHDFAPAKMHQQRSTTG